MIKSLKITNNDQLKKYLHKRSLRLTDERRTVFNEISNTHEHLNADDLYLLLKKKNAKVSRATVYRTLDLLVNSGLVRRVKFDENHAHYEHTLGHRHHDHLMCVKCGKIIEFTDVSIENLQNKVCRKNGFKAESHSLKIFGLCKDCI